MNAENTNYPEELGFQASEGKKNIEDANQSAEAETLTDVRELYQKLTRIKNTLRENENPDSEKLEVRDITTEDGEWFDGVDALLAAFAGELYNSDNTEVREQVNHEPRNLNVVIARGISHESVKQIAHGLGLKGISLSEGGTFFEGDLEAIALESLSEGEVGEQRFDFQIKIPAELIQRSIA